MKNVAPKIANFISIVIGILILILSNSFRGCTLIKCEVLGGYTGIPTFSGDFLLILALILIGLNIYGFYKGSKAK